MAAINRAQISDLDDIMISQRYKSLETSPNDNGNAWVGFILVDFGGTGMCLWYCWKDLDEQDLIEFI